MTCPLEDFLKSDMGADDLDGCLDNFRTLLFLGRVGIISVDPARILPKSRVESVFVF